MISGARFYDVETNKSGIRAFRFCDIDFVNRLTKYKQESPVFIPERLMHLITSPIL